MLKFVGVFLILAGLMAIAGSAGDLSLIHI